MTQLTEAQAKELLYRENQEFKTLKDKHANFDMQLQQLLKKGKLTDEEQLNVATIKKQKLSLKDKMYSMIMDYMHQQEA
ncbi:MAG: YdcH family protein [Acidobacteria bacterium]|nr:YdcH family protein [Acidobacteriota bacterium]